MWVTGGRGLTAVEVAILRSHGWLEYRAELAAEAAVRAWTETNLFCRMTWLYWTGKSAYRYTFRHGHQPDGSLLQKNGLRLPRPTRPAEICDWRAAILEQLEKMQKGEE